MGMLKVLILGWAVALTAGCDKNLRGYEEQSLDGGTYLVIDELNGPGCISAIVDDVPWPIPLHKAGKISPGPHEIKCPQPIKFVVRQGTTFHFDYWGP